jgi:hypothetical protein
MRSHPTDLAALFRAVLTRCPNLQELNMVYDDAPVFRRVLLNVAGSGQRIPPLKANPIPARGLEEDEIAEHVAFMEHLLDKLELVESYELPCCLEAMLRRVRRGLPAAPSLRYVTDRRRDVCVATDLFIGSPPTAASSCARTRSSPTRSSRPAALRSSRTWRTT